jgi:hypothetical protein
MITFSKGLYFTQFLKFSQGTVAQMRRAILDRSQKTGDGISMFADAQLAQAILKGGVRLGGRIKQ